MSAGICLMNKNCIVLAADSAVTIGQRETVFNSADKLFELSNNYPIGCIIYQSMDFMNIPIGVILKKFRNYVDENQIEHENAEEYFVEFEKFLNANSEFFRFKQNEFLFIAKFYRIIRDQFKMYHKEESSRLIAKKKADLDSEDIDAASEKAIKKVKQDISKFKKNKHFNIKDYVIDKYADNIKKWFKEWFKDLNLKEKHLEDLNDLVIIFLESNFKIDEYTGMNIAGFGKSQIFPSSAHFKLYGIINGKIKYDKIEVTNITEMKPSSIKTLAQRDVIDLFTYGINNTFLQNIGKIAKESIDKKLESLSELLDDKEKIKSIKVIFDKTHEKIRDDVREYAWDNYLKPLESSIAVLPNDELIQLAEEMINLTSLRRKIIIDNLAGTVGGPVDIAIINLDEGFNWKCKKRGYRNDGK